MTPAVTASRTLAVWLPLLLLVTACEDAGNPVTGEDEPGLVEEVVDERCEEVDETLLQVIEDRLAVDAPLEHASAVPSEEEDVTFVAAELGGQGHSGEPPVGIWAVRGDPDVDDPDILAVNAVARADSEWPFDEEITEVTDGGEEAKACVDGEAQ